MKTKVILLETKDKSSIGLNIVHNHLFIVADMAEIPAQKYQHIYLIDETAEIPYNPNGGTNGIFLCLHELDHPEDAIVRNVGNCKGCRKIIASTDSSLVKECTHLPCKKYPNGLFNYLPLLSEQSIKLLIDYYNKNGKMPESVETTNIAFGTLYGETVDISIPEDRMYTKDEVESLCKKTYSYGFEDGLYEHGGYEKYQYDCNSIGNWIKDNLT